ncbi:MAG: type II toxin-antitoxin system HigB family toxin [Bacteroidaceae bacterium]|nr:type II toxin-antitoxin system HigB family toxin [Bacteroidaceae bacterium]
MIIANKEILDAFVQKHAQAAGPLNTWVEKVKGATWHNHAELKQMFPSADYVKNGRYVFNIGGNNYRLVAVVIFIGGVMNIRFVGTHPEYDKIDSSTI